MADTIQQKLNELSERVLRNNAAISTAHIPRIPESATNPARWTHTRLGEYVRDFESKLDDTQEIGARLVSFGSTVVFHIQSVGYYGPDIITFHGVNENGERVQLIQNISQLSVLLVAMKKINEKPRRIGFTWDES